MVAKAAGDARDSTTALANKIVVSSLVGRWSG